MTTIRDVLDMTGRKRRLGIMLGSWGAVMVRVICTFALAQLLNLSFVKLIGGALISWIAVKLIILGTSLQ